MAPSFAVAAMGYNATQSLVASQVVLSLALPVPMVALLVLSRRRAVMGAFTMSGVAFAGALAATALVLVLNAVLLLQTAGVAIPGLG